MSTRKAKISFRLKRIMNFLNVFRHSGRGMVGVGFLVFFSMMALIGPLLTPYNPVALPGEGVSGDYAVPSWFQFLPGGENLTENLELLAEPGFITPDSLQEWNFTVSTSSAHVSMTHDQGNGYISPGCAAIEFMREAGKRTETKVYAHLTKEIRYPFHGPPKRFTCTIVVLTEGVEDLTSIDITVFIRRSENESYPLWIEKVSNVAGKWIAPVPPMDSYASKEWVKRYFGSEMADPEKIIFSEATDYTLDIQILFRDSEPSSLLKDVRATVYVDDVNLKLYGTRFGLLGTDQYGRDIFTQLVHGSRISLSVGLFSALLAVVIGLLFGLTAGYLGRVVDEILMRFTDMLLVLPTLPLLLVLIAVLGPSMWNLIMLIGLLGWMGFTRVVRSQVLSLKERPFVEAAKAIGAGKFHIILTHILPNVVSLVYVALALAVPGAILAEAALSWLGLYDPHVMSWGRMLHDAQFEQGIEKWWWIVPPGLCIALVSLSFILLGYALDEILNPKLRRRR